MRQPDYNVQAFAGPAQNKQPPALRKRDVVVIIAGGPSLTREDVEMVENADVDIIGINNAYQITDKLDIHYGCDTKWWRVHYPHTYPCPKYSLKESERDKGIDGVQQMERGDRSGLSRKWPVICTGGNSGYQAVNLAYLLGFKRIILLGYDMQYTNKKTHWHPDHQGSGMTNPANNTVFQNWRREFKTIGKELKKEGVEVINATRQTALDVFPRAQLEDVL